MLRIWLGLNDDVMYLYKKNRCSHWMGEYITRFLFEGDSVQISYFSGYKCAHLKLNYIFQLPQNFYHHVSFKNMYVHIDSRDKNRCKNYFLTARKTTKYKIVSLYSLEFLHLD